MTKFLDKDGLQYFWEKVKANDYRLKSGTVEVVTTADTPYTGAVVGDKYLDLVVNTLDNSGTATHIYVPLIGVGAAYSEGNGIDISNNNVISVQIDNNNAHGLSVGANGLAFDDSNLVHKAGAETITGEKTFSANVNLSEFPTGNNHATNKIYVDSTIQEAIEGIEGNFTFVSAKIGEYNIFAHSLVAFASKSPISSDAKQMELTPFTQTGGTSLKNPIVNTWFPIGCKIYYNDASEDGPSGQSTVPSKKLYLTHKSVDARYSAVTGSNVSLGYGLNNTVYLRVSVNEGYWSPYYKSGETNEIIVSANQLIANNYYIYLGKTVGSAVSDVYTFELDDNNPLYYYTGSALVDWASYIANSEVSSISQDLSNKADKVANATNGNFAALDSNGNLTDSGHKHSDYLTSHQDISGKEDKSNKVTSLSSSSTDTQYPSAKIVYDQLDTKQDTLVSGTNIKTVNNTSLLGSGNITINDGVGFQTITTQQDGTMVITLTNGDTITIDLNHTHPNYYKKVAETTQPQGGFLPDVVYSLGTLTGSVTFAIASAVTGNVNHYFWMFDTSSTAPTITWPSRMTWQDSAPTISASKHYEISVLNDIAMYLESNLPTPA